MADGSQNFEGNTPGIPRRYVNLPAYLSGFVDGEDCFCVTFNKSKRHKFGWDIRPSFSASQNRNRAEVLNLMKDYFNCGSIRPDRSDQTLKYEIRSISELVEKILPHFESYPMLSSKQKEFKVFAEICCEMHQAKHLTPEGFGHIVELANSLNAGGKKKYLRTGIQSIVCT